MRISLNLQGVRLTQHFLQRALTRAVSLSEVSDLLVDAYATHAPAGGYLLTHPRSDIAVVYAPVAVGPGVLVTTYRIPRTQRPQREAWRQSRRRESPAAQVGRLASGSGHDYRRAG